MLCNQRKGFVMKKLICFLVLALLPSLAAAQATFTRPSKLSNARCGPSDKGVIYSIEDATSVSSVASSGTVATLVQCTGSALRVVGWVSSTDLADYALLAGDADGQTIQGRTGANAARVDIGEGTAQQVRLIGSGATPGYLYAYDNGVFASSPDEASSWDLYDGGMEFSTDGDLSLNGTNSAQLSSVGIVALNGGAGIRVTTGQTPPTNANDSCGTGDFIPTTNFIYFCVASNTWQRVAIATWP